MTPRTLRRAVVRSLESSTAGEVAALAPALSIFAREPTRRVVSTAGTEGHPGRVEVRVHDSLTIRTAHAFCRAVRDHLAAGARALLVDLEEVKAADVVGLAALFQGARLAALLGVPVSVFPSAPVHRALLQAELLDELPPAPGAGHEASAPIAVPETNWLDTRTPVLATTARLALRQPTWEELPLFEQWAHEPLLDQMVGSELLYRCRHLGPYHPDFVASILNDATALTLLVQPLGDGLPPVGFVRLYKIRLLEQLAFLETAVADPRALRKGWGIEASRLLIACGMDLLGLRRVEAKVYAYNLLSINSLKRNGFQQEGVLRQAKTYDGQRWDILVFSLLREEMEAQRRREQFPYAGFWGLPT